MSASRKTLPFYAVAVCAFCSSACLGDEETLPQDANRAVAFCERCAASIPLDSAHELAWLALVSDRQESVRLFLSSDRLVEGHEDLGTFLDRLVDYLAWTNHEQSIDYVLTLVDPPLRAKLARRAALAAATCGHKSCVTHFLAEIESASEREQTSIWAAAYFVRNNDLEFAKSLLLKWHATGPQLDFEAYCEGIISRHRRIREGVNAMVSIGIPDKWYRFLSVTSPHFETAKGLIENPQQLLSSENAESSKLRTFYSAVQSARDLDWRAFDLRRERFDETRLPRSDKYLGEKLLLAVISRDKQYVREWLESIQQSGRPLRDSVVAAAASLGMEKELKPVFESQAYVSSENLMTLVEFSNVQWSSVGAEDGCHPLEYRLIAARILSASIDANAIHQ